ncbi:MAG TPA: shikimate kinase AroK [Gammaproteobacteria bacterium]|nr:shikimate kinase AroK [Gammaproteobacteria bacterium]
MPASFVSGHAGSALWLYTWLVTGRNRNIYLIGPTGSGKTAVGKQLARDTGLKFLDSDQEIEKRTGVEIAYIFEKEGEAGFREREQEMIRELSSLEGAIVATGGGAVLAGANRERLAASGVVVYLKTGVREQLRRTGRSPNRPLLNRDDPRRVLEEMAVVRAPLYEEIADLTIDTSSQRVRSVAKQLREMLEERGDLSVAGDRS